MAATHLSGPLITGDLQRGETDGPNRGYVTLVQSTSLTQNSTTAVSSTLYIPAGSIILDFYVDVLTAFNSATSATLTVGIAAAGTEYVSGVNVKAATGRIAPTFTAAQLAAMSNQTVLGVAAPTTAPLVITITPVGATSAGYVNVSVQYVQLTSTN
jgi:hypothetical protein